ncbi:capsular polysaccharide export protein, LipB/KpsS family [Burkholderia lata]|uniref:Capsule polysaccharide export protein n=1 Tax=Burkholderia lata (strain ATCC 17760 / DSM 23089 / LMG 22485 / NCIMB 9086 / R18194 / 383) TaxID=482957 RepID=A0A6P2KYX9_BURL3|nr:capsular biosynthesis protein [Burkholderia lata]VWB61261.1 capsule polysaccharide export protein [Burkholderia lata]
MSAAPLSPARDPEQTTLDLRNMTRKSRFLGWLLRRADYIWVDRRPARILFQLVRMLGAHPKAAYPGLISIKGNRDTPLLSWFVLPSSGRRPPTLADAINHALANKKTAPPSPNLTELMKRVLDTHALDPARKTPICPADLFERAGSTRVLLVDERTHSGLEEMSARERRAAFDTLITTARNAHPQAEFLLARTNAHGAGRWLSSCVHMPSDLRSLDVRNSLCAAIRHVDHVYTISAPEGMHALLSGVPTHTFGRPYYAGWGLTSDHADMPERRARPTLATLFDIVFLQLSHYLDPVTQEHGSLESLLDIVELQRSVTSRFAALGNVAGIGFQWWKRPFATPFLNAGGCSLRWLPNLRSLSADECAALWGARSAKDLPAGRRHIRIEDGFLHSNGLGSDMIAPRSQVIDTRGLYFDSSRPSDLTALLNESTFSDAELSRAAALRARILRTGLAKYNLGRRKPAWQPSPDKLIVLVPGQVADDASIRLGTRNISTLTELLEVVRARRPDACIVYKPHPDVLSGNRKGLLDAQRIVDIVDTDSDLVSLIDLADEVHTLSSLAGFDALLRGKAVFTYGIPFYAGWGLTHDALAPLPWRHRILTLDMLTAGALLRYPIYWDWRLNLFTTPEAIVRELAPLAANPLRKISRDPTRPVLKAFRWTRNAVHHLSWRWQHARKTARTDI